MAMPTSWGSLCTARASLIGALAVPATRTSVRVEPVKHFVGDLGDIAAREHLAHLCEEDRGYLLHVSLSPALAVEAAPQLDVCENTDAAAKQTSQGFPPHPLSLHRLHTKCTTTGAFKQLRVSPGLL